MRRNGEHRRKVRVGHVVGNCAHQLVAHVIEKTGDRRERRVNFATAKQILELSIVERTLHAIG
jgi:hypothetical protein